MKNLKRKVILSAIVLVFAFVATIGSTFAWFTVAQEVTVQEMEMNVSSADSLLIRVYDGEDLDNQTDLDLLSEPSNYFTSLTEDMITQSSEYASLSTWALSPVTVIQNDYASIDGLNLNTMEVSDANLNRTLEATIAGDKNSPTGKYIEIKFWILSQAPVQREIIMQDLVIDSSDPQNSPGQQNVDQAIRLSVFTEDTYDSATEQYGEAYVYGLDTDYDYAFVNNLPAYSTTAGDAVPDPLITPNTDDGSATVDNEFNYIDQLTTAANFDNVNSTWYESSETTTDSVTAGAAVIDDTTATTISTINNLEPLLVNVRIFVEGWDVQTLNEIISSLFTVSFQFAYKPEVV